MQMTGEDTESRHVIQGRSCKDHLGIDGVEIWCRRCQTSHMHMHIPRGCSGGRSGGKGLHPDLRMGLKAIGIGPQWSVAGYETDE